VVARHQHAAAIFPKAPDRRAIFGIKAVAGVDREKPKLVEIPAVER